MSESKKDPDAPEVKALSQEEVRAKLADGLLPGEDVLFYDMQRYGARRAAEPSEVALYEPPQLLTDPDRPDDVRGVPPAENKVIINSDPGAFEQVKSFEPLPNPVRAMTTTERTERTRRLGRIRTKEILLSVGLVGAVSLLAWWVLILQADSNAQRKPPDPGIALARPAHTHEWVDDAPPAPDPATSMPVVEVRKPAAKPVRSRRGPEPMGPSKLSSRPKEQAAGKAAADPEAREWLNPTIERK
jgi:hypothetical protein